MVHAVFPGTFDPPTLGHISVVEAAAPLFERLTILLACNKGKSGFLDAALRMTLLNRELERLEFGHVRVDSTDGLVTRYCAEHGASVLVRGLRSAADLDYELDMSHLNRTISGNTVQTVFIPTVARYSAIRSSSVRELLSYGVDVSFMVPPSVRSELENM